MDGSLTVLCGVKEGGADVSRHLVCLDLPLYLHVEFLILLRLRRTFHSVKTVVCEK